MSQGIITINGDTVKIDCYQLDGFMEIIASLVVLPKDTKILK
jgi:hypothetical protein